MWCESLCSVSVRSACFIRLFALWLSIKHVQSRVRVRSSKSLYFQKSMALDKINSVVAGKIQVIVNPLFTITCEFTSSPKEIYYI